MSADIKSGTPDSNLNVLVTGTSDRLWKISEPLEEVGDNVSTFQIIGKESVRPLLKQAYEEDPDVIITDALGRAGAVVYIISGFLRIPCVLRIRGDAVTERISKLFKNLMALSPRGVISYFISTILTIFPLLFCKNQVYVSKYCRDGSRMRFFSSSTAVVVPTPVRGNINDERNTQEDTTLLAVTSFNFWKKTKGLIDAIDPIVRVLEQNSDCVFKIAGDGPHMQEIKGRVKEADTDAIELLGHVENINNLYTEADIFVHFSYLDAYPSTVNEASLHRLPIVANEDVGMSDQINDGESGYIVNLDNPKEVERRINFLLNNEGRRAEMGRNAKILVKKNNSITVIGESLNKYLSTVYEPTVGANNS